MSKTPHRATVFTGLALLAVSVLARPAAAQSELDASEATAFLGQWVVPINSDYGPFTIEIDLRDEAGKVAATVGVSEAGMSQDVTNITRNEARLILRYDAEYEGQYFPVTIQLEPEGDGLSVGFDAADGQFFASGTATRSGG
jgi:hypothetical protein